MARAAAIYGEAVQYYAKQRVEVAQAFIDAVEDAVYRIRESPTRWAVVDEDIRRCLTRKFPYAILLPILENLSEALLDFTSFVDLQAWLEDFGHC